MLTSRRTINAGPSDRARWYKSCRSPQLFGPLATDPGRRRTPGVQIPERANLARRSRCQVRRASLVAAQCQPGVLVAVIVRMDVLVVVEVKKERLDHHGNDSRRLEPLADIYVVERGEV